MTQEPEPSRRKPLPVRWLTLAEIVGLGALVVAGLGYWDSHRERIQQDRDRAAAEREQTAAANQRSRAEVQAAQKEAVSHALLLTGSANGAELRLKPARGDQVIQNQTLWFPTEVRADSVSTTGNPRIEAGWIEDRLRRAAKPSDHRLPVAIETSFIEDGVTRTDRSLYLVGFSLHGRLVGGPRVEFEGLSLAKRGVGGDLQAAANGYWIGRR
jgi:hypothetical protein